MASSFAISPYSLLLLFFIFLFHSPYLTSALLQRSNATDKLALLAIKAEITHDPLQFFASWNDSLHFCGWSGVTCGRLHQRVTSLNLADLSLVGTLSPYVSNLTFLKGINIELNTFHGKIPQEIGGLFRLRHLNLTNNSFSGEIPANISGCSSLVLIKLGWNRLTGSIPSQLGTLPKLERVHLHYNNLSGTIPRSLGNLSSIRTFSFAVNNFQGAIPAVLGQLKNLGFLGLGLNQLTGTIPPEILNLSSLASLSLPYNQLQGTLPDDLGFTLPNLQVLNLGHNLLTGPLPTSLSNSSNLVEFDITGSYFNGKISIDFGGLPNLWWLILASNPLGLGASGDLQFFDSLTKCRNLKVLDLSDCRFGGTLPYSVANLSTNLLTFRLGGNELSGSINVGIENLVNLTELQLQKNKFTGGVPAVLGDLSELRLLDLSENELSGSIPPSLSEPSHLYMLRLNKNNLNGSIPLSFGNFQYLQDLDLSQNNLSGPIPKNLMRLSSLTVSLNLADNELSGSLPSEVGELKNLEYLDVSKNRLSDEIPVSLGSCVSLGRLDMAGNSFQGPIPSSFSSLRGLEYLNLSRNNLSGRVPGFLQRFSFKNLNLSFNQFEGQLPSEGIFSNASAFSVAGNNKLCGGIPELNFAMCPKLNELEKRKSHHLELKLMIPLLSGLLALVLIVSLLIIRRLRKTHTAPLVSSPLEIRLFSQVTYDSLHKATDGFSSANFIGAGGFASVYKGTLESGRKIVAVKVFNVESRGNIKSFLAECRTLRNIRHRNLVRIYTVCSTIDYSGKEFKALVYEFMPNGSLERWLHGNSNEEMSVVGLSLVERVSIAIDVASALDYLHHHCPGTIVHCDLKPSNILLDDQMVAHLGDFGLSKFIPEVLSHPQSSSVGIMGTIGYAPPEYGMGSNYSPEGDIYSYGILLLEMFTGKRPIDSGFEDGINLHNFVKTALPERVGEIVDPAIALSGGTGEEDDCLISIMRIGVACSVESPKDRMNIANVVKELESIKANLPTFSTNQCSTCG
ncbi:LRR receptor-like serine/threonine-protein kinase EFR [Sesamum alatum]|uniref:non-specific serine/threonine protein kinase n=1 Tax=Sesamum alatum TaxID=300844 RepID=A0AAE1YLT8_9LAMI|nr:LRR receptor-like serine/threonine-protein kinase EFR [Sesamum alatum]